MLALLAIPALTFLRAFLIGIVVSILYAGAVALWRSRRKPRPLPRGARPRCGRVVLLGMATIALGTVIFLMKTGIRAEGDELSGREIIWPIEIASVIQHPIFGLGPFGDVDLLRFKEDLPQLGAAHSDYLGSAVCYGLPGLLLFVAALCSLWRRILRFGPVNVEESACRYAALFSLAGLSTTMIAENVIRDPRLFTLYLLFPGLVFLRCRITSPKGCEQMTSARRIVNNTLSTYVRLFVVALTGLFAVPVALRTLGAVDYGIYSVIGGCLAFLTFLNISLQTGAQRHIAYALGERRGRSQ